MNTKIILGIMAMVAVIGGGGYVYSQNNPSVDRFWKEVAEKRAERNLEIVERKTEGQVTSVAKGWSQYTSDEGPSFSYPSNWKLMEQKHRGFPYLTSVEVEGDGYVVEFTTIGKGFPSEDNTQVGEYVVAGKKTKILENKYDTGFLLGIGTFCDSWSVRISSPSLSKEVTDKILASVECSVD